MGNSPSTPDGGNSPSAAQEGRRSSPDSSRSRNSRQWVQASQREAAHALGAEALQDQRADDDSLVGRLVGRPEAHAGGGIWESTGDEADDLVDILEEHALWPKDLGTEDMPFFGTTCPEEVSRDPDTSDSSRDIAHHMELFGLGAALESAYRRGMGAGGPMRSGGNREEPLTGTTSRPVTCAGLHYTLLQQWRRAAVQLEPEVAQEGRQAESIVSLSEGHTEAGRRHDDVATPVASPSPSEIMTASSIRMILSMATTFRRSNPAVLGAMCSTLVEVLLEAPPLALAPLCDEPASIEASTFRRVGDFCAELIRSSDASEREHALGLYLALAVSRGSVSGLLEVTSNLLDRSRESVVAEREVFGAHEAATTRRAAPAVATLAQGHNPEQDRCTGAEKLAHENSSEQWSRISNLLGRLANHPNNAGLPPADERDFVTVVAKVPRRHLRATRHVQGEDFMDWGHPASAATDGIFVYGWHPGTGLVKVGTGMCGTAKDRVYAENAIVGRLNSVCAFKIALPRGATQSSSQRGSSAVAADLVLRADGKDRIRIERAGDLAGWKTDEVDGNASADGGQHRRLLVHYKWRGFHDMESFSEDQPVEIPTARARRAWSLQPEVNSTANAEGQRAAAEKLCVMYASCVSFAGALQVVGQLFGEQDEASPLIPNSLRQIVLQYLLVDDGDFSAVRHSRREGFVAVACARLYVQAGSSMPPHRFLVMRTSDLAVEGIVDAPSFLPSGCTHPPPAVGETDRHPTGSCWYSDDESKTEEVKQEEKVETRGEATHTGGGQHGADIRAAPAVPLCCDGRLLYALLPSAATGEPSVVAVNPADECKIVHPTIELCRSNCAPEMKAESWPGGESDHAVSTPAQGRSWWRSGGAVPGVRTFCDGNHFVVCWREEEEAVDMNSSSTPDEVGKMETDFGLFSNSQRIAKSARFRLSTGEYDPVGDNPGRVRQGVTLVADDFSRDVVFRCYLRRPVRSSTAKDFRRVSHAAELCVSVCRQGRLASESNAGGPFGWRGALRTLAVDDNGRPLVATGGKQGRDLPNFADSASDAREPSRRQREAGSNLPSLTRAAVCVLAHLDRMAAHSLQGMPTVQQNGTLSVPFGFDLFPATFQHLVKLVSVYSVQPASVGTHGARTGVLEQLQLYVLCASLRVLRVNVDILLRRGMGVIEFGGESLRDSLLKCLLALAEGHGIYVSRSDPRPSTEKEESVDGESGRKMAAEEALRLVVEGMDLFYPARRCQACLLSAYLQAFEVSVAPLPAAARVVTAELLARASSPRFLLGLEATKTAPDGIGTGPIECSIFTESRGPGLPPGDILALGPDVLTGLSKALIDSATVQSVRVVELAASGDFVDSVGFDGKEQEDPVGRGVLRALASVLKLRSAIAAGVIQSARQGGEGRPICEAGGDRYNAAIDEKARPLLEFLLLVLQGADHVLNAAGAPACPRRKCAPVVGRLRPAVERAVCEGLVGNLLPSVIAACWALVEDVGTWSWVWSCTGATETLLCSLQAPLVNVVRKLGILAIAGVEHGTSRCDWTTSAVDDKAKDEAGGTKRSCHHASITTTAEKLEAAADSSTANRIVLHLGIEGCTEAGFEYATADTTGNSQTEESSIHGRYRLARLEFLCATLGASMVEKLIRGERQTSQERANALWLRHPLLHAGAQPQLEQTAMLIGNEEPPILRETTARASKSEDVQQPDARYKITDPSPDKCTPRPDSTSYLGAPQTPADNSTPPFDTVAAKRWETTLMVQLCRRPSSRAALALASAMKRAVREDQGLDQSINEAVWAAAAAVVHHAGLTEEASEVARAELEGRQPSAANVGLRSGGESSAIISLALIRAWRSAQQVRFWLQSAASPGRDQALLTSRASFLLSLEPWALTIRGQQSLDHVSSIPSPKRSILSADLDGRGDATDAGWPTARLGGGTGRTVVASELVLQFLLRPDGPTMPTTVSRRDGKADGAVDSITCVGDIGALLNVIERRSARAEVRSRGFSLAEQLLEGTTSDHATAAVLRAVAEGLAAASLRSGVVNDVAVRRGSEGEHAEGAALGSGSGRERSPGSTTMGYVQADTDCDDLSAGGSLHFLSGVHCCGTRSKGKLVAAVEKFLKRSTSILEESVARESGGDRGICFRRSQGGSSSTGNVRTVRVEALRAVSMDYGWDDHEILHSSELLPQVVALMNDTDPSVAAAASETMQAFYRCVVPGTGDADDGLPGSQAKSSSTTSFQQAFIAAVRGGMHEIAEAEKTQNSLPSENKPFVSMSPRSSPPPSERALLEGTLALRTNQAGYVVPHFPLGTHHTLSLWIFIPSATTKTVLVDGNQRVRAHGGAFLGVKPAQDFVAAVPEDPVSTQILYVVAEGEVCVVRRTPSLSSEYVGTLNAGEDVAVVAAQRRWASHPLVTEGLCVRVAWPMKGFASRYAENGSMLLRPNHNSRPSQEEERLSAIDSDVAYRERGCALYMTPDRMRREGGAEQGLGVMSDMAPALMQGGSGEKRWPTAALPRWTSTGSPFGDNNVRKGHQRDTAVAERSPFNGGIILFKGNEVLLGDEGSASRWNRLGIEATPAGALRFFVGEGGSSEVAVSSPDGALFDAEVDEPKTCSGTVPADCGRAPGWFHVAVVQDTSKVSLFLNGRLCGAGALPLHLQQCPRPEYRVSVKEVESAHPYLNSTDDFWEVRVPGATSITVRFDPRSRTEPEYDFVRFYRDHTRTQTWGLDKYHGGQSGSASNWPGVDLPPLEIPADFFVVHFHSDGSNNDYGFRLTAESRHPVFSKPRSEKDGSDTGDNPRCFSCADVGPWPLYLGQPPPHASPRKTIQGGVLAGVHLWNRPLLAEEVAKVSANPPPAALAVVEHTPKPEAERESKTHDLALDDDRVVARAGWKRAGEAGRGQQHRAPTVQVLSLAHACCRAEFGRKAFSNARTVRASLRLVLQGPAEERGWVLRVCRATLPWIEPQVVDHEFRCIVREQDPTFEASFIESCLLVVGKISGVWGNFGEMSHASRAPTGAGSGNTGAGEKECATQQPAPRGSDILDMLLGLGSRATCTRVSAREAFSLSSELVSLVRGIITKPGAQDAAGIDKVTEGCWAAWAREVAGVVRAWLRRAGPLVDSLQGCKVLAERKRWMQATEARQGRPDTQDVTVQCGKMEEGSKNCEIYSPQGIGACGGKADGNGGVKDTPGSRKETPDKLSVDDLDRVVAALCVLGGHFESVHPGAKVICKMPPARDGSTDAHSGRENRAPGAPVQAHSSAIVHGSRWGGVGGTAEEAIVVGMELAAAPPGDVTRSATASPGRDLPRMRRSTSARTLQEAVQIARAEVSGLVRRSIGTPGGIQPVDVHDELAHDVPMASAFEGAAGALGPAAATGRETAEREMQQHLTDFLHTQQQSQDIAARMATARLGSYFRRPGGWDGPGRLSPDVLVNTMVGCDPQNPTAGTTADGSVTPATTVIPVADDGIPRAAARAHEECDEWVTVASARGGPGGGPRAARVSISTVAPIPAGVPAVLARALMPYAEDFVPQLKALLEIDTEERGPSYLPVESVSDLRCVVESAHPYKGDEDRNWPVVIKGAETIEISFDPRSRFARPGDQLILSWRTPLGAGGHRRLCPCSPEKRQGDDTDRNGGTIGDEAHQEWPGVGDSPPLILMAETLSVRFVSATVPESSGVAEEKSGGMESVGGAWGFRLTASGREVCRTTPPAQPPSLARAMLCDLRARAVKSAAALLEHDEASAGLTPLIPALTKVALGAAHQAREGACQRTRTLESSHPYENSTNEEFYVSFKGATRLSIAFDSQSRTETNCDYVVFHKNSSQLERWGEARYSGRDGGENWPGCGHRPPLQIPASEVFVKWVTDTTVTDWGWKMTITADLADMTAAITPPAQLEQMLCRVYDLLYEQPKRPTIILEEDFAAFPISSKALRGDLASIAHDLESSRECLTEVANPPIAVKPPSPSPAVGVRAGAGETTRDQDGVAKPLSEAHGQPRGREREESWPRRYIVCMGGVEAFALPFRSDRSGAPVAQLRHGAIVEAVAQKRDWLEIVYDSQVISHAASASPSAIPETRSSASSTLATPTDATPPSASAAVAAAGTERCHRSFPARMWVRQRQDDAIFLIPEASSATGDVAGSSPVVSTNDHGIVVTIPRDDEEEEEEAPSAWGGNDAELVNIEAAAVGTNVPGDFKGSDVTYDAGRSLRGNAGDGLWAFATGSLCTAAARFGVSAILTIAARWRGGDGKPFTPELFGSFELFWEFLRLANVVEGGNLHPPAMSALRLRVVECVRGRGGGAFGRSLVEYALDALRKVAAQPGTLAIARVFETPHPYENNMDVEWKIHLPGARCMKIVFDHRSRTETNCDWLEITQEAIAGSTQQERPGHSARYHGSGGNENFPGFGGRPPLWLDGDRFVARFQSDTTSTDWGVRFVAYGVLDDKDDGDNGAHGGGLSTTTGVTEQPAVVATVPAASVMRARDGVDDVRKHAAPATGRAAISELDLSCWLLEFLSREASCVPEVAARLCDTEAMGVLHDCLNAFCQRKRLRVLRLISSVVAEARLTPVFPSRPCGDGSAAGSGRSDAVRPSAEDVRMLLRTILALTEAQRFLEGDPPVMSTNLQALIQCAILLHSFLVTVGEHTRDGGVKDAAPAARYCVTPMAAAKSGTLPQVVGSVDDPHTARLRNAEWSLVGGAGATAVRDVATVRATLLDFAESKTPLRLLLEDFLPVLTEACSVTVQSTHPFDRLTTRQIVTVPGAVALQARFDPRTEMGEDNRIIIRCPSHSTGRVLDQSKGTHAMLTSAGGGDLLHRNDEESSFLGLTGGSTADGLPLISVGDRVVRGTDWALGDEDRGDGIPSGAVASQCPRTGVVVALERWAGREGGGARVRWTEEDASTGAIGLAVEKKGDECGKGFEALYSVRDPAHLLVVKRGGPDRLRRPVVVAGDSLEVEADSEVGGDHSTFASDDDSVPVPVYSENGGRGHAHCLRFDGESTHVDLPSYGGMRLEGDFTLEVWAWLEPGTAKNGKPKCVLSRALNQPLLQSRRMASSRPVPDDIAAAAALSLPPSASVSFPDQDIACSPRALATVAGDTSYVGVVESNDTGVSNVLDITLRVPSSAAAGPTTTASRYEAGEDGTTTDENGPAASSSEGARTVHIPANVEPKPVKVPVFLRVGSGVGDGETMSRNEGTRLVSAAAAPVNMTFDSGESADGEGDEIGEERPGQPVEWSWVGRGGARRSPTTRNSSSTFRHDGANAGGVSSVDRTDARRNYVRGGQDGDESTEEDGDKEMEDDDDTCEDDELVESEDDGDIAMGGCDCAETGKGAVGAGADVSSRAGPSPGTGADGTAAPVSPEGTVMPPNLGVVTSDNVYLGLRVMRGPHWRYRQQDRGVSNVGTVVGTRGLDGSFPADGDNPIRGGWTKVRWDNGRANSYETGFNGRFAISFADAVPSAPRDLVVSSVTDRRISIRWATPAQQGRPPLHSYVVYRDGVEIATVAAGTLSFTNANRMRGWPYSYSVAARGSSGEGPRCPPVEACTATQDDRRTQLALWVGGRGVLHFAMGNDRGKGVLLEAGEFPEGVWTHLAVSVEGRKVDVFVDGKRSATGNFVGRRLCSRAPSPAISHLPSFAEQPLVEPLRLGSRGAQDYWPGRLCDVRVWGAAAAAADVRRRMVCPPSASLVRVEPPPVYRIAAPAGGDAFQRLRVHAPLPDPPGGAAGEMTGGAPRRAYYEVVLRSGGCIQIGWALPSCRPASPNLGVGDDDFSWSCDGLRAMKWHGTTSPVSSPYAHGVPYGSGWRWRSGDVIGCAIDLDVGEMSFSHNGVSAGTAFVKARNWGTGRYRVIAEDGLVCRVSVDPDSPIVEIFTPGTVLQVSQVENPSPGAPFQLRTAEGWVSQRSIDDPDMFFLERLQQDTCPFANAGTGAERCVFVDTLRSPQSAAGGSGASDSGGSVVPHASCDEIVLGAQYGEISDALSVVDVAGERTEASWKWPSKDPRRSRSEGEAELEADATPSPPAVTGGLHEAAASACGEPPLRSILKRSVEVGDADAVTVMVELFVPASLSPWQARLASGDEPTVSGGAVAVAGTYVAGTPEDWRWGVVLGDFDIYMSTKPSGQAPAERDNGGNVVGGEEEAGVPGRIGDGEENLEDGQGEEDSALHVIIVGPGGLYYELPLSDTFIGRWMTLRIVARRSRESLLLCSPGNSENENAHNVGNTDGFPAAHLARGGHNSRRKSVSITETQFQSLKCTFSNPCFFRGDRVGCVGFYSKRSAGSYAHRKPFPFRARHAVILLGATEELLSPPSFPRLRTLERLLAQQREVRLTEPAARPLLVFARRLRRLWSGNVSPAAPVRADITYDDGKTAPASTCGTAAIDATPTASAGRQEATRGSTLLRITMWEPVLPPGRVSLGTAVFLSRTDCASPDRHTGGFDGVAGSNCGGDNGDKEDGPAVGTGVENGSVYKRCLTAWEHPALQTPARFDAVPLPPALPALSSRAGSEGQGLWAWVPVPRSDSYLAVGLTFTTGPAPPPLTAARCVLRELVKDADPQKCKVVALTRGTKKARRGEPNGGCVSCMKDSYCSELVLVKETGVCVPKDGTAWGLSPRVVIGDPVSNPARRGPRWEGLMPTLSCVAGESMVINLGRSPFRYPIDGYQPLCQMVQADARFVLQVYSSAETLWEDVRPSHGLSDGNSPPSTPDLVGRWLLGVSGNGAADGRELQNHVFGAASCLSRHVANGKVRLPPARASRLFETIEEVSPAPPLKGAREVWGFSVRLIPRFPSNIVSDGAHPWLRTRFEAFLSCVWGEPTQAQSINAQLVRYVNAVALRRGMSKDILLSCDWSALGSAQEDLADWPLLQSISAAKSNRSLARPAAVAAASKTSPVFVSRVDRVEGRNEAGAGQQRQNGTNSSSRGNVDGSVCERRDEWIAVTPNAPEGGQLLRDAPVDSATESWRLAPGQIARLLPPQETTIPGRQERQGVWMTAAAEATGWRRVGGLGGGCAWLAPTPADDCADAAEDTVAIERYEAERCLIDGFSVRACCGGPVDMNRWRWPTGVGRHVGLEDFWVPLRREERVAAVAGRSPAVPSPFSAVQLQGNSDALLLSAMDMVGPMSEGGGIGGSDVASDGKCNASLLVAGKWKVGLVTDTLTVATRTSGFTRVVSSSALDIDAGGRGRGGSTATTTAATTAAASDSTASSDRDDGSASRREAISVEEALPALVDGLVFGFRGADGLLFVARALPTTGPGKTRGWGAHGDPVEPRAVAHLGGVDEGTEISFSVVDAGEEVMFSCREVGGRRRAAMVRARCRDSWGRGRVAFGARVAAQDASTGWLKVVSQAHGATVRSGMSIDADSIVGRIPCGTVVPYDSAVIYTSPGAQDRIGIDPVVRYRCIATATTPAGWISERGRYANHPYRICEVVRTRPRQPPHLLSHVSIGGIRPTAPRQPPVDVSPAAYTRSLLMSALPLPRPQQLLVENDGQDCGSGHEEWQRRLSELSTLAARFHLMQRLNRGVAQALPYVDLSQGELPWSLAALLSRCRHLIFSALKLELWHAELARTARDVGERDSDGDPPVLQLLLSRGRAARKVHSGNGPHAAEEREGRTLFGQAFSALRYAPTNAFRLRPGEALYNTVFVGEHAHDAGGPYRESFAEYCAELQSDALPLLIRCPNAVNEVGFNREKWVPSPALLRPESGGGSGVSAMYADMLGFLGRLMGVAIRSRQPLDLDLPSIVWKQLVRSPITRDDLEAIDSSFVQTLAFMKDIHLRSIKTAEDFRSLGLGGFDVATVDGGRAELPDSGGSVREITLENRQEFVDRAEAFKKQEFTIPVEAIRRGLGTVVPCQLLRLFSWDELEVLVCGRKEVDVDLLEACTEYSLCDRQDPHVSAFWEVLRSFSPKEKALFLRFTWGRSRLPMSADQFQQPFKIQAFSRRPADSYLPVAHTCFFSLELPQYSSRQIMEAKLRYAIYNCQAIDADDTSVGRNAAGMGWGEEP